MNDLVVIGFAVLVTLLAYLIGTVLSLREKEKDCERYEDTINYLHNKLHKRDDESEKDFKDLVAGIDGVISVSLSAKRYVELLRAEENLVELQLKAKELGNG